MKAKQQRAAVQGMDLESQNQRESAPSPDAESEETTGPHIEGSGTDIAQSTSRSSTRRHETTGSGSEIDHRQGSEQNGETRQASGEEDVQAEQQLPNEEGAPLRVPSEQVNATQRQSDIMPYANHLSSSMDPNLKRKRISNSPADEAKEQASAQVKIHRNDHDEPSNLLQAPIKQEDDDLEEVPQNAWANANLVRHGRSKPKTTQLSSSMPAMPDIPTARTHTVRPGASETGPLTPTNKLGSAATPGNTQREME